MSTRQLQRSFHEVFAFSPRTYWMKCRIRAASEALRAGHEPIIAISQRLGFCDQSNFTQQFRRHTGLTPSAYVKQANARRSSV
jgi:AraC-like DNA-binding protein